MADMMTFPNTVEEFMEQYKITDTEQIYTNGAELVPIFRMKQWFDHRPERKKGEWIEHHEPYTWMGYTHWTCSECGFGEDDNKVRSNFCPKCGAKMER